MFLKVLLRLGWLGRFNVVFDVSRNGSKVKIPIVKSLGHENLTLSELWMCDVFEKLFKWKQGSLIDIGVNLGQTLIKLKLVDESISYVGFDPNPVCIYYTKELIRENGYKNAVLVPTGVADQTELIRLNFYTEGDSDSSASIIQDFRPDNRIFKSEFVACFDYERLRPSLPQDEIAIVKVDVEGAELEVIKGIRKLLETKRPLILIEILPVYDVSFTSRWNRQLELEQTIKALDYRIFRILKSGGKFQTFQELDAIGVSDKIEFSDYLLCPKEDVDKMS